MKIDCDALGVMEDPSVVVDGVEYFGKWAGSRSTCQRQQELEEATVKDSLPDMFRVLEGILVDMKFSVEAITAITDKPAAFLSHVANSFFGVHLSLHGLMKKSESPSETTHP